jgi:hypothetical protein
MKMSKKLLAAVAAAALLPCGIASAAPFIDVQILASSDGGNTFTSTLQAQAGQTYQFEVVGQLAPVGTTNTNGTGRTITSEVAGTDGIGSLSFNLANSAGDPVQINFNTAALQGTFTAGTGAAPGTLQNSTTGQPTAGQNNEIAGSRPVNGNGVLTNINGQPGVIESGTFTVESGSGATTVGGSFAGVNGGFKINDGSNVFYSSTTEAGTDPFFGYAPLTVTTSSVPEPASMAVFGLGAAGLLMRRRKTA